MFEELFLKRLTQLRLQKGVSAREMSLAIGQRDVYKRQLSPCRMVWTITSLAARAPSRSP